MAAALRPVLPSMLAATATAGGCTQEVTAGAGGLPVFICDPSLAAEALCCRRLPALGSPSTLHSPHDLTVTGLERSTACSLRDCANTYCAAAQAKDRLVQIVHFWRDKGVYDAASVAELETAISTGQVRGVRGFCAQLSAHTLEHTAMPAVKLMQQAVGVRC